MKELEEIKEKYKDDSGLMRRLIPIEKSLQALEIIVKKEVNIFWIKLCFGEFKGLEMYNAGGRKTLIREEYDLLKEVFDE